MWCPTIEEIQIGFSLFFVAGGGLERLTFTFPLNPPLIKGDLWQGLALHCFAILVGAFRSLVTRLEISMLCPTIEEIHAGFSLFFIQSLV